MFDAIKHNFGNMLIKVLNQDKIKLNKIMNLHKLFKFDLNGYWRLNSHLVQYWAEIFMIHMQDWETIERNKLFDQVKMQLKK